MILEEPRLLILTFQDCSKGPLTGGRFGRVFTVEQVEKALNDHGPFKAVGIVHAETSTGADQPIMGISRAVHDAGALLLVDTITSLGGMQVDGWGIEPVSASRRSVSHALRAGLEARVDFLFDVGVIFQYRLMRRDSNAQDQG